MVAAGLKSDRSLSAHFMAKTTAFQSRRGCDHDCGHGGFCDLRTSLSPILGRSLLRQLGWLGLGWSLVGRLGRPLSLGPLLSPIAPPRFSVAVLRRAPQSSSASGRLLE